MLVPEGMRRQIGGQLARHEAEFHEGLYSVLQQAVVDLIDVGEVVDRMALGVFVVNAHLVLEDGVKADVLKTGNALHGT